MNEITLEEIGKLALEIQKQCNRHTDLVDAAYGEGWDNDPTSCSHIASSLQRYDKAAEAFSEAANLYWFQEGEFESDDQAVKFLEKQGYKEENGLIIGAGREETKAERAAINYLCTEWDYGFEANLGEKTAP